MSSANKAAPVVRALSARSVLFYSRFTPRTRRALPDCTPTPVQAAPRSTRQRGRRGPTTCAAVAASPLDDSRHQRTQVRPFFHSHIQESRLESLAQIRTALAAGRDGAQQGGRRRLVVADDTMHYGSMRHECRQIARQGALVPHVTTCCRHRRRFAPLTSLSTACTMSALPRSPPLVSQREPLSRWCGYGHPHTSLCAATPRGRAPLGFRTRAWSGYCRCSRLRVRWCAPEGPTPWHAQSTQLDVCLRAFSLQLRELCVQSTAEHNV